MTTTQTATKKTKAAGKPAAAKKGAKTDALVLKSGKRANVPAMLAALAALKVEIGKDARPDEIIAATRAAVAKAAKGIPPEKMLQCDDEVKDGEKHLGCQEVSTEHTPFCPFCGLGDPALVELGAKWDAEHAAGTAPAKTNGKSNGVSAAPATEGVLSAEQKQTMIVQLDTAVAKINELAVDIAGNSFDLGVTIRDVHERQLWKARGHSNFKEFIEKELPVSRTGAYLLMDVVKDFDRDTFLKHGAHKLALISGIDDEEARRAALADADAGKSVRDIARTTGRAAPNSGKGKASAPASAARAEAPPKKKENEITLLAKVNGKANLFTWRSAKTNRPLNAHQDDAYAAIPIGDDVVLHVALKTDRTGEKILGITGRFVRTE